MNCRNQTKTMKQQKHELQTRTGRRTRRASAANCCAVPSLMLKPRNTPYPLPGLGRKGASLPYMANEIVVATLFMVPRWRPHQFFPLLLCAGCRWIPLVFVSNLPFGLLQYIVQNSTKCRLGRNSWRHSVHPYGGTRCVHPVCFI